jgi:hypothetical protein
MQFLLARQERGRDEILSTIQRWWFDTRSHGEAIQWINFGTANVDRHTHIVASITEISQPQGQSKDFPFQGAAKITVNNIAPFDDGTAKFWTTVAWESDLDIDSIL